MYLTNSENSVNNSSGSHLQERKAQKQVSPRNLEMFETNFGLQVQIDGQCKMTFSVPRDRFLRAVDLIRDRDLTKKHYLSMVNWDKIPFGYSNEEVFTICFHLLAAGLIEKEFKNPKNIPDHSWVLNIPSEKDGWFGVFGVPHELWIDVAPKLAGFESLINSDGIIVSNFNAK